MKITFNTGRLYTRRGQIIVAEFNEAEEFIVFNDRSRGISGRIETPVTSFRTAGGLASYVMERYDRHEYRYHPGADRLDEDAKIHEFRL